VSVTTARPETAEETTTEPETGLADPWVTIVWNDPVNLMTYVTYVFESYFGYPPAKARQLMLQVHREGRAVVSTGPRERMEVDVQAMHSYGLWATLQRSGQGGAGAPDGAAEGAGA
jgi:ATP-dependent Clp protease adaptor protein ClpS